MKLFLDTADIDEIRTVDAGASSTASPRTRRCSRRSAARPTTRSSRRSARSRRGPCPPRSWPTTSTACSSEGRHFAKLADNIVVKVPMSENGLEAMSRFRAEGIKTNCTLIFTANQGLLAAKAGASLLSPFVGRLDDINEEGMIVIRELSEIVRILRARLRGARGVGPPSASRDRGGARRRPHRHVAVQGLPADGPPPADRQGHRRSSSRDWEKARAALAEQIPGDEREKVAAEVNKPGE